MVYVFRYKLFTWLAANIRGRTGMRYPRSLRGARQKSAGISRATRSASRGNARATMRVRSLMRK